MKATYVFTTLLLGLVLLIPAQAVISQHGHDRAEGRPHPMHGDKGFEGSSNRMNITGSIEIVEGIKLSLSIEPSKQVSDELDRMGNGHADMMKDHNAADFEHGISVILTGLVEFEDLNDNGFDEGDTVLSTYELTGDNLGPIQFEEVDETLSYTILSTDGVFEMYIIVNTTNNVPHEWKWSLVIDYPFSSSSSELAMLHTIETSFGNLLENRAANGSSFSDDMDRHRMEESNGLFPMFFSWLDFAIVDDVEVPIEESNVNDQLSLSVQQGELIEYDPSIGVDPESIESLDKEIDSILTQTGMSSEFMDQINSPTVLGLTFAVILISAIFIITYKKN